MVILPEEFDKNRPLLRVVKKLDKNLWNIYFLNHDETGKEYTYHNWDRFKMTAEVIMNAKDLKRFAEEIRWAINTKPFDGERLHLTFQENQPQFTVLMCFMQHEDQISYLESKKGKMRFVPLINTHYSVLHHDRPEDQYVYDEGNYTGEYAYYDPAELLKFADDLEKEADSA